MEYRDYAGYRGDRDVPMKPVEKMVPAGSDDEVVRYHGFDCYVKVSSCPRCGGKLPAGSRYSYCPGCGQHIKWE